MEELEKNINKRKIYISLLVSVICIISVSYAFFVLYLRQTDNNTVTALSCFTSTLTEENSVINLTNEFPIKDEDGIKKTPFTFKITNNCNNYVKAYITIDSLKEGTANYILSKYMKANVSTKGSTNGISLIIGTQNTKVLDNKHNGYIVKEVGLNSKESKEFDLRLWIDYDTTKEQAAGMTYTSQVVIVTEPGKPPTFAETILANNEVKATITTPGAEISAYKESDVTNTYSSSVSSTYQSYYVTYGTGWEANGTKFNLTGTAVTTDTYANSYASLVGKYLPYSWFGNAGSSTAGTKKTTNLSTVYYVVSATQNSFTYKIIGSNKNTTEALLASTEDDYGTSYYFRGSVTNNYVEFANKCWQIVRVGGDNTIKLILHNDNTVGVSNPCSSANNSDTAAFAQYNDDTYTSVFNTAYDDNAFVGFMYGDAGCVGASGIDNDESSCSEAGYEWKNSTSYNSAHTNKNKSKILTNLEKWYSYNLKAYESVIDDNVFCNDKSNVTDTTFNPWEWSNVTGLGYAKNVTYYGAMQRLTSSSGNAGGTEPSLKCNGELSKITSKIGLITADELAFAGYAAGVEASQSYLQENALADEWWWSLSPDAFDGGNADVWGVKGGNGALSALDVGSDGGVRPYISLRSSTNVTGDGTSENPYKIIS